MEIVKVEKLVEHPMEQVLDIEPGTTMTERKEVLPSTIVTVPDYDVKDTEIESKLEEIYAIAMSQVVSVGDALEGVEGKYKARIGEAAANMLNVALGAVREKRELKQHKDDLALEQNSNGGPKTVNNNLVVTDRNNILKLLSGKLK